MEKKEYIDKDEFYDVIDGGFDLNFDELPESKAAMLEMIRNFDPADVKPVVRGEWVLGGYDDTSWCCSVCGYERSPYYAKPRAHFCENCGADMRGEGDE